jgi:hypothetical protein
LFKTSCAPVLVLETKGDDVYVFGSGLERWEWQGNFLKKADVTNKSVLGVIAKWNPIGVVENDELGESMLFSLNDDKLTEATFEVVVCGPPRIPTTGPDPAAVADFHDALKWSMQLDAKTRNRNWSEANAKSDLSPHEKVIWVRDECRKLIEAAQK